MNKVIIIVAAVGTVLAAGVALLMHRKHHGCI